MKKSIFLVGLVISLVSCNSKPSAESAGAGEAKVASVASGSLFKLDSASSTLTWKGFKPGGEHTGVVSVSEGTINIENNNIVSGSFIIDLNTINDLDQTDPNMNAKLVGHLKSPDFFDVAKFPTASFEIVSVSEIAEGAAPAEGAIKTTHQVTGNLTMKGITKSISFPAEIVKTESSVKAITPPFSINRTEWGVNYGSKSIFAELKDKFINDEIVIVLNLSFSKN
jgi:polyisoprenoid-binding protein YceI